MAQSLGKTIKKVHPSNAYICTCSTLVGISGMRHATVRFCLTSTLQNQSNASRYNPSSALLNKRWLIHQSRCNRGPIRSKFRTKADQPRLAATIEFRFFFTRDRTLEPRESLIDWWGDIFKLFNHSHCTLLFAIFVAARKFTGKFIHEKIRHAMATEFKNKTFPTLHRPVWRPSWR